MNVTDLKHVYDLVGDGHDPDHGDEEAHRAAHHAEGWVVPLVPEDSHHDTDGQLGNNARQ